MLKPALRNTLDVLDRAGLRKPLAAMANIAVSCLGRNQRFSVDESGNWVNQQCDATFVSPDMLFSHYPAKRNEIIDLWCHQYTPREGDVVIDVGAGIGDEAYVFSQLVGGAGRVLAIEGHPRTFDCLKRTVRASGLINVTCLHCAVSNSDGSVWIGDKVDRHISNSILVNAAGGVEVPAKRLDRILAEQNIGEVALLKMNIEGAEHLAIEGIGGYERQISHYAISCHDFMADRNGAEELRTREKILAHFRERSLEISRRAEDPRPWVRDYVYARKT